ncbi:Lipoprotein signal peptidase [Frankliniella fusca]|uniref:Lipoprotein signal peptidase n=1 Tax=Frankliniella fusca TaxID=407009 RepID=A0AAE1HK32_9NEOP|nr:Lipoprotein signal peptidase [Frankliniella fusca]
MQSADSWLWTSAGNEANFALQLKGWRENMENFCGSKPPEGGCGSRQAQGFYPLWQPTASVFHGNRRFADCDPIAQFDRFDPRTTIGLPLEVRAVSRALDFLNPVSEALPQRGTRDSNPQPRVPTRSQNRKRPNAQSHRANGVCVDGAWPWTAGWSSTTVLLSAGRGVLLTDCTSPVRTAVSPFLSSPPPELGKKKPWDSLGSQKPRDPLAMISRASPWDSQESFKISGDALEIVARASPGL